MSAHHFFTDPADIADDTVVLRGAEAHHATRSLRIRDGERITVADGTGRVVTATVTSVGDVVRGDVSEDRIETFPAPAVTLMQAVTKQEKLELVVEKATEVGVQRIVPFVAERSIVTWDERKVGRVTERARAIALAAAKQSRSPFVPAVDDVAPALPQPAGPCLALHEAATRRLRDALDPEPPATLTLVVGPEGGLSEDEIARLVAAGAQPVSLGPRILRTETAGPVAAAIVGYRYGWFG